MNYISTRGGGEILPLSALLTRGTAADGGLFVPQQWPQTDDDLCDGEYADIATRVLQAFGGYSLPDGLIEKAVHQAMGSFHAPVGPPLTPIGDSLWAMELMHGPTLAFKDFALVPLAEIIDQQLLHENKKATVLCATSGDTGTATVAAFANRERINAVVLFPDGGVSEFQRKQMTTTGANNILPLCVEGDFDDCQRTVKKLYQTEAARHYGYTAVNSINIVRILLQTAYYLRSSNIIYKHSDSPVNFVVPTGNFGNIYAAYIAKQLGAPIGNLVISSNDNDVLPRLFNTGRMEGKRTIKTISPSMDIQVSSNFERLLWHIKKQNTEAVDSAQNALESAQGYDLAEHEMSFLAKDFLAHRCEESDALATMKLFWQQHQKLICPHTATAFHAVNAMADVLTGHTVVAETAHPAKFSDAVKRATGITPAVPEHVQHQFEQNEFFVKVTPNEVQTAIDNQFGSAT